MEVPQGSLSGETMGFWRAWKVQQQEDIYDSGSQPKGIYVNSNHTEVDQTWLHNLQWLLESIQ